MPRLALFAQRDIHAGEELTFDYASSKTGTMTSFFQRFKAVLHYDVSFFPTGAGTENGNPASPADSEEGIKTVKNECRCGAATCRKIMFSLPENQSISLLKAEQ